MILVAPKIASPTCFKHHFYWKFELSSSWKTMKSTPNVWALWKSAGAFHSNEFELFGSNESSMEQYQVHGEKNQQKKTTHINMVKRIVDTDEHFGVDEFHVKYGSWIKWSGKHRTRAIDHNISLLMYRKMRYFIGLIGSFQVYWTPHVIHPRKQGKNERKPGRVNSIWR